MDGRLQPYLEGPLEDHPKNIFFLISILQIEIPGAQVDHCCLMNDVSIVSWIQFYQPSLYDIF